MFGWLRRWWHGDDDMPTYDNWTGDLYYPDTGYVVPQDKDGWVKGDEVRDHWFTNILKPGCQAVGWIVTIAVGGFMFYFVSELNKAEGTTKEFLDTTPQDLSIEQFLMIAVGVIIAFWFIGKVLYRGDRR